MSPEEKEQIELRLVKEKQWQQYNEIMRHKAELRGEVYVENISATGGWSHLTKEEKESYEAQRIAAIKEREARDAKEHEEARKVREAAKAKQEADKLAARKAQEYEKRQNRDALAMVLVIVIFVVTCMFALDSCSGSSRKSTTCYETPRGIVCETHY